jgi:hypothetical protein
MRDALKGGGTILGVKSMIVKERKGYYLHTEVYNARCSGT